LRDELLNDLCKLAIPNNLENIFEVKEKNILIIRAIFNLIHCINLLDYSSWIILIETIQNLYFILLKSESYLYNYQDQFNINLILNDFIENIKKYSYKTDITDIEKMMEKKESFEKANSSQPALPQLNINNKDHKQKNKSILMTPNNNSAYIKEMKEKLTEEQKENIEILSKSVNTLFIESNSYDDDTLKTIIKALYDNTKKIFDNYIKEKLETKKSIKESNNTNLN
jgi:protein required for attachment to host cells